MAVRVGTHIGDEEENIIQAKSALARQLCAGEDAEADRDGGKNRKENSDTHEMVVGRHVLGPKIPIYYGRACSLKAVSDDTGSILVQLTCPSATLDMPFPHGSAVVISRENRAWPPGHLTLRSPSCHEATPTCKSVVRMPSEQALAKEVGVHQGAAPPRDPFQ